MAGIVLHDRRVVYWQIPKAACTTIKRHLCHVLGIPAPVNPHNVDLYTWTDSVIEGYYNFAIVRNPFSRLYSLWKNKVKDYLDVNVFDKYHRKIGIFEGMSFDAFIGRIIAIPLNRADIHYAPQCIQLPPEVTCVHMENIHAFMMGVFPVENSSGLDNWRHAYTPKTVAQVVKYYINDFKRFGYPMTPWMTILVDCDGVLTDGKLTIDHAGEKLFKRFHTRDVRSIRQLVHLGYHVVIVSADDWPGIFHFANKVGAEVLISQDKKENGYQDYIAIGDDAWDVSMIKGSALAFVPADADQSVLTCGRPVIKLNTPGGQGVMAEVLQQLLGGVGQ